MPLAIGYLKAACLADERLRDAVDIRLVNFNGAARIGNMAATILLEPPDILAISVFGWNLRSALALGDSFKQANPGGWLVLGGTHVSNQGERLLTRHPQIDIVVNGEGEETFPDILDHWLRGGAREAVSAIRGTTSRQADGTIVTSEPRARITDLDAIPSPVIAGAVPIVDASGAFRYDVAIMETNRGCPYKCAFCYWGGAIGQKMRYFSLDRLTEELEIFAFHQVPTIVLCDANFGMQNRDEEFLDAAIRIRERYGYPKSIETSWAKNKSQVFYRIVKKMKQAKMRSSFTLALQTLNDDALSLMDRRNMKLNAWHDLVAWLEAEDLDCYAELIWGAPGETAQSFLEGYDRLSEHVSRIATYPLLLLPNTSYDERRSEHGFVTVRGDTDDFEYVVAHNKMSLHENLQMQPLLFWSRVIAENSVFRYIWHPARLLGGLKQSDILRSLMSWFEACDHPAARPLKVPVGLVEAQHVAAGVRQLFTNRAVPDLLGQWWSEAVAPQISPAYRAILGEIFRLDLLTLPITDAAQHPDLAYTAEGEDGPCYLLEGVRFEAQVDDIIRAIRRGEPLPSGMSGPWTGSIRWRAGFLDYVDNHETALWFFGRLQPSADSGRRAAAGTSRAGAIVGTAKLTSRT